MKYTMMSDAREKERNGFPKLPRLMKFTSTVSFSDWINLAIKI